MAQNSRRVLMTRRMIKDALIELMNTTDFAKISVSDVCAKADINRSTFYSHYADLFAVLADAEDDIISRLPNMDDYGDDLRGAIKSVLSFIMSNAELMTIMIIKRKDDSFMQKLLATVLARYEHLSMVDEVHTRMNYTFCVGGIVAIIKEWILSNFSLDLDSFTDIALSLAVKVTTL